VNAKFHEAFPCFNFLWLKLSFSKSNRNSGHMHKVERSGENLRCCTCWWKTGIRGGSCNPSYWEVGIWGWFGVASGDFVSGYSYHMSVRTRLSDHTKQTKFQSQWPNDVETPVPSIWVQKWSNIGTVSTTTVIPLWPCLKLMITSRKSDINYIPSKKTWN
jgi:hypothetical protein